MSDALRKVYEGSGALDRFFDKQTPVDLFRGRRMGTLGDLMQPTLIGWLTTGSMRPPDVLVQNAKGVSPQYNNGDFQSVTVEGKDKALTAEILRNADQYIVKGCRTMSGLHRGISVFDKKNGKLRNFDWYKIPANSKLPDALAITRDKPEKTAVDPIHYTIAPKDDMPLALFLQYLKGIEALTVLD